MVGKSSALEGLFSRPFWRPAGPPWQKIFRRGEPEVCARLGPFRLTFDRWLRAPRWLRSSALSRIGGDYRSGTTNLS
jgi:hypothetical protein